MRGITPATLTFRPGQSENRVALRIGRRCNNKRTLDAVQRTGSSRQGQAIGTDG
jgi:hypothetical protein